MSVNNAVIKLGQDKMTESQMTKSQMTKSQTTKSQMTKSQMTESQTTKICFTLFKLVYAQKDQKTKRSNVKQKYSKGQIYCFAFSLPFGTSCPQPPTLFIKNNFGHLFRSFIFRSIDRTPSNYRSITFIQSAVLNNQTKASFKINDSNCLYEDRHK